MSLQDINSTDYDITIKVRILLGKLQPLKSVTLL